MKNINKALQAQLRTARQIRASNHDADVQRGRQANLRGVRKAQGRNYAI